MAMLSGVPVGTIIAWGGLTPPAGYLECAGQSLNRSIYKGVFSAIGTIWGSDTASTFKLPDFNSAARFLRSRGNGVEVGEVQGDAIRNIKGAFSGYTAGNVTTCSGPFTSANATLTGPAVADNIGEGRNTTWFDASKVVPIEDENRPKSAVVMYCIKVTDEYINPEQVDMADMVHEIEERVRREEVQKIAGTRLWLSDPITHINEPFFKAVHNLPIGDWKKVKCDFLLVCKVEEHGYSIGQPAQNVFVHHTNSFTPTPFIGGTNHSEVSLRKGSSNNFWVMRATDGAQVTCSMNKWELYFRIWY